MLSRRDRLEAIASRIKGLRVDRKLKQEAIAQMCGVSRVQVSRWEHALDLPSASALLKISEMVPDSERQWWRDEAAEQAGVDLQDINPSVTCIGPKALRTIPLIKRDRGVGALGEVASRDVERELYFPVEWFPEGGDIRALRFQGVSATEMVAMVDTSRRDADRLVGHMVAVHTPLGIEIRWLGVEAGTYLLLPFQPGQSLKLLRPRGENSIIGLVRWVGDSVEPPEDSMVRMH